ncbi:MAG: M24 family metallopeptidase [Deltaproteobacteria bacterium]|nr:M24 family metallopeptidase [Deltaproteobacteria bacterium]
MSTSEMAGRLERVRAAMRAKGVDALVVRGTDAYLSEYVPEAESGRVWLTGFTGSLGDALVSHDQAWLFVDGRYHVQADRELDASCWTAVKNPLGVANESACATKLAELASALPDPQVLSVGYEPGRYSVNGWNSFRNELAGVPVRWVPLDPSPVAEARGPVAPTVTGSGRLRVVDESSLGRTVDEKVALVAAWLATKRADALLVTKLDELAWLANLRGEEMPYQATFRALGVVTRDALHLSVHVAPVTDAVRSARPTVRFCDDDALAQLLSSLGAGGKKPRVALDPASVSAGMRDRVEALGMDVLAVASPVVATKAKKTEAELAAMKRALRRADGVVAGAQAWLNEQVGRGERVTEVGFAAQVERMFRAAGAVGLSFKVISAFGTNGASVHHPPSDEAVIAAGQLMLLDTGCYFEEGFATDLTRTFFVGGPDDAPTAEQRRLYTLTLKSAIAGMTARVPRGASGAQIDGITRRPLWSEGLDYAHGTGHGVGINVHEAPPSIGKTATTTVEPGHVFSIEPGLYIDGVGGVRIENLCTVRDDAAHPGFLQVEPLTFAPLDGRLIDLALLDAVESNFLRGYTERGMSELGEEVTSRSAVG